MLTPFRLLISHHPEPAILKKSNYVRTQQVTYQVRVVVYIPDTRYPYMIP